MRKITILILFFGFLPVLVSQPAESQIRLDPPLASHFAKLALKCIKQEYPNKPGQVFGSDADLKPPREIRPAFYGCFDWHSAVHGHWMLVRLMKDFPGLTEEKEIRQVIASHLTPENIQTEVKFFLDSNNTSFERMYGWAWLLKLSEELYTWSDPQAKQWSAALKPLSDLLVKRYLEFLPKLNYPIRVGEHTNTAFGLAFAWDYANTKGQIELKQLIEKRVRDYYLHDKNCPAEWEPGGYDFFSPCLMEADLMGRILPAKDFQAWLKNFLPGILAGNHKLLLNPGIVSDRTDGKLVHLDGLNFNRAWCLYRLAHLVPKHKATLFTAADRHMRASLPNIASGDYSGEHWLASFAVYALIQR